MLKTQFEQKYEIYQSFLSDFFQFLEVKFCIYLNRRVFRNVVIVLVLLPQLLGKISRQQLHNDFFFYFPRKLALMMG